MVSNRIETYCQDSVIYRVCFQVMNSQGDCRYIKKNLTVKEEPLKKEVADISTRKFSNVQEVKYIDCWLDAL